MRFIHLRISNYRGIELVEVDFGPNGITLIQGPNETGKTSLNEAIGLIFEYLDSSKHRNVEAVKPVHVDAGPEVELTAESGPYLFTYFKRFLKKPETKLTIVKPKPENYTGREAHERAEAILRETLDIDLWKALCIQQGDAILQPDLSRQRSLSAALDKAAGGSPSEPQEEGLFDRAYLEYSNYYTERGGERKDLELARRAFTETEEEIASIKQAIQELNADIDRSALLQQQLRGFEQQESDISEELAKYTVALEEIAESESILSQAKLRLESALKTERSATRDQDDRVKLIEAVSRAAKDISEIEETRSASLPSLKQAEIGLEESHAALRKSEKEIRAAEEVAILRRADFDYFNNKLHLEQLQERKSRIDDARLTAAQAEATLLRNVVDSEALDLILDAERSFLVAVAQFQTGAPTVLLRALDNCLILVDDAEVHLSDGETRSISVADRSRISVPSMLDVEITAGASTEDLTLRVEEAQRSLENLCTKHGVSSPDNARKAHSSQQEARRDLDAKELVEKENLRDLTYDELAARLTELQQIVPDYLVARVSNPELCPDLDSAKQERLRAELLQREASEECESLRQAWDSAREVRDTLNTQQQESRVELDLRRNELNQLKEALQGAREDTSDQDIETAVIDARKAVASEEAEVRSAKASLEAINPGKTKALAETSEGSLRTLQKRKRAAEKELTEVQARLRIHGEEGLHERLQLTQAELERIKRDNASLFHRAIAAKCLFELMREERDKIRRAYVGPLKEKVEHLGRLVYDGSFQVEVNEDLQIVNRTIGNITVSFDSLSGGTQEQLSLIFRAACSMIVAEDGGVPLILDDTLGNTDPQRLHLMGAVLAKAAKDCQIVILSCVPDRYDNVGEATVVTIG